MVAFKLSFIKLAQLYNYQIQDVIYDSYNNKIQFRLANYFADFPGIIVTIKYFRLGSDPKYSVALSDTDDIEFRMTSNAEESVESLAKFIADGLKDTLGKGNRKCRKR